MIDEIHTRKVTVQFLDNCGQSARIPYSDIEPLEQADDSQLPSGVTVGSQVLARYTDPGSDDLQKWYPVELKQACQGLQPGEVLMWVEFQPPDGEKVGWWCRN